MSKKTEEKDDVCVPVDELEKELSSVVQKLMNELRKAHSRNTDMAKKLQSTEQRLHEFTMETNEKERRILFKNEALNKKFECLMEELHCIKDRNTDMEKKLQLTEQRLHECKIETNEREIIMQCEKEWLVNEVERYKQELFAFTKRSDSLARLLETKEKELREKDEVIKKKNSDMDALNKHITDGKIYIEKMQTRLDDITELKAKDELLHKETVESLKSQIQQLEAKKSKDDLMHKETIEELQSRIQEMSAVKTKEYNEHRDIVKKLQAHIDEERRNRFELSYQYSQLIQAKKASKTEMKPSTPEPNVQSLLLLRQDKEQQTENSHYISELSDEKRPTKLAEEYSELYDNEWTDAFEDGQKRNEEQKVDFLLKLLMRANEICQIVCNEHTNTIKRSFCTLVVEADPSIEEVCDEVPGRLASESKGTKQGTAHVQRRPQTKKIIETDYDQTLRDEEKTIVIEIGKSFKQRLSEDLEKVGTEIIMEEHNINPDMESIVAYIRKCMNICWSMCKHVPPLHIDFSDVTGGISFDTNKYKPYTKSGKLVHYIVWPAVYLHEDGPLLSKGVAQGTL